MFAVVIIAIKEVDSRNKGSFADAYMTASFIITTYDSAFIEFGTASIATTVAVDIIGPFTATYCGSPI